MVALQEVWTAPSLPSDDPMRSFAMSWKRLRDKYKHIQELDKQSKDLLAELYDRLTQLKLDILEDSMLFHKEEFQELRT